MRRIPDAFAQEPLLRDLPPQKWERLQAYVALLDQWRGITNLIAGDDFERVWSRHVLDSLALYYLFPEALRWLDIGSGAGFPAIVLGVMLADHTQAQVHCVEADARKCAFLRHAAAQLHIPLKVHNLRAENLKPDNLGPIDIATARAFAPLKRLMTLLDPFLLQGTHALLPRGRDFARELAAIEDQRYVIDIHDDLPHSDGAVLRITPATSFGRFL